MFTLNTVTLETVFRGMNAEEANAVFPKAGRFIYQGVQVFVEAVENYEPECPLGKETIGMMVQVGGALAGYYPEDFIPEVLKGMEKILDKEVATSFRGIQAGHGIVILKDFFQGLTRKEQEAVLAHEVAHVRLEHFIPSTGKKGIVIDLALETQADELACLTVEKQDLRNGMLKMMGLRCVSLAISEGLAKEEMKTRAEVLFQTELQDNTIRTRLEALA